MSIIASMLRIVCFGEVLIDFLAQPLKGPDEPRTFAQYAGGAPANVAAAVAKLGGKADFVGMVGADMFGDFLTDALREAGVGTSHVLRTSAAKTALAFVQLDDQGERSFSFYRPPSADLLFRAEDFAADCFERASAFHVCSNSLTEADIARTTVQGVALAREAGLLVSFDVNLRPALWSADADPHPRLWEVLRLVDVVKLARPELEYLAAPLGSTEAVLRQIWQGNAQCVIVTDGAAPLRWITRETQGEVPSFQVRAVDCTAAGDAFLGGLLFQLVEQRIDAAALGAFVRDARALRAALRFAAAVGALAVTRYGAFAAMPSLADVRQLLQEQHEPPRKTA